MSDKSLNRQLQEEKIKQIEQQSNMLYLDVYSKETVRLSGITTTISLSKFGKSKFTSSSKLIAVVLKWVFEKLDMHIYYPNGAYKNGIVSNKSIAAAKIFRKLIAE